MTPTSLGCYTNTEKMFAKDLIVPGCHVSLSPGELDFETRRCHSVMMDRQPLQVVLQMFRKGTSGHSLVSWMVYKPGNPTVDSKPSTLLFQSPLHCFNCHLGQAAWEAWRELLGDSALCLSSFPGAKGPILRPNDCNQG